MVSQKPDFIYLASQSPRRAQLLEQLGVRFEKLLPDPHEDSESIEAALPGELPRAYVQRVTGLKLDAALVRWGSRGLRPAPVLCSDTTVALGRTIYGKPTNDKDAARMLGQLQGKTHRVLTAVAIETGGRRWTALSISHVRFAPMSSAQIRAYVASGEPHGKAGAYAIQARAGSFVEHITGSYSAIMGLPLYETAQLLRQIGLKLTA